MEVEAANSEVKDEIASGDDSLSPDEQEEIESARLEVQKSPTFDAYKNLISVLRKAGDDIFAIRNVRSAFAKAFPLPASNWIEWAEDELMMASTANERQFVARDVLQRGLRDYASLPLSAKLLQLQMDRFQEKECTAGEVRATFEQLKQKGVTMHFSEGAKLWEIYLRFLEGAGFSEEMKKECIEEMGNQPIKAADETENDISKMTRAAKIQRPANVEDLITSCEVFESKLADAGSDPSEESGMRSEDLKMRFVAYAVYLTEISTQAAKSVWERCMQECFLDNSLWRQYSKFCRDHRSIDEEKDVLERSIRNVSWDLSAWHAMICNIMRRCEKKVISIEGASPELVCVLEAVHPHVYSSTDWDGAMRLSVAALMCYNMLKPSKECREAAFATVGYSEEGSVQWGNSKFAMAAVCFSEGDMSGAIGHIEDVITRRPTELRWWHRYTHLLLRARVPDKEIREVFRRGVELLATEDDVEAFGSCWIEFEAMTSDTHIGFESAREAMEVRLGELSKVRSTGPLTAPRQSHRSLEREKVSKGHGQVSLRKRKTPELKKRRKQESTTNGSTVDAISTTPKGNAKQAEKVTSTSDEYERNTVFINNLPYKATEEDLRQKFDSVGKINGIRIPKRGDGAAKGIAYIEFADAASMVGALALHQTPVCGREIWVRRSKPPRNAKKRRPAPGNKHTTGHKPRLTLDMKTDTAEGESAMDAEQKGDGDTQMTDAGATDADIKPAKEQFKTQDDFRSLLLGKK